MPRRSFGLIRKLPSGNYQASYVGPDLVRHPAPQTFTRKAFAERWLLDEKDLTARDDWMPPSLRSQRRATPTLDAWFEQVLKLRATRTRKPLAQTTIDLYRKDWRLRVSKELGAIQVTQLTPSRVTSWWAGLDPATPTQNARAYALLNSVMRDAVDDELIERNPCRLKAAGKPKPAHDAQALTIPDLMAYLEAVPANRRLPLMIAALCGLRSGEVRGLRRRDVDGTSGATMTPRRSSRYIPGRPTSSKEPP
ncbi:site-specific integrase [Propionibacterium freudenreichii]|uniref:site-specific integrase n=1 Tax=Propionibacterium freudenreichii TaxID=1744 RepID=UPI0013B05879|nr:hypothetical protein [Propionibacterium freudenreichii]